MSESIRELNEFSTERALAPVVRWATAGDLGGGSHDECRADAGDSGVIVAVNIGVGENVAEAEVGIGTRGVDDHSDGLCGDLAGCSR